jgi:radical SAM superfamily enzyme YgiQ (UPF0313 family)
VQGLDNDKILELMYKAGCREIFIGFESGKDERAERY